MDLLDQAADAAAAKIAMRRAIRQVFGTAGAGLLGALALISLVLAIVPGDAPAGMRAALALIGLLLSAGAGGLAVWGWRQSRAYRQICLPRQAAQRRFFAELGVPGPNAMTAGNWLGRLAATAYSTPSEVREMRAQQRGEPGRYESAARLGGEAGVGPGGTDNRASAENPEETGNGAEHE